MWKVQRPPAGYGLDPWKLNPATDKATGFKVAMAQKGSCDWLLPHN